MAENENVGFVQELYGLYNRGDMPALLQNLAEGVEWQYHGPTTIPWAGHYRGRREVGDWFASIVQHAEVLEFDPQEFLAAGDRVAVFGRERMRVRSTGKVFESQWSQFFTVANRQVTRFREVNNTAMLVAAFTVGR